MFDGRVSNGNEAWTTCPRWKSPPVEHRTMNIEPYESRGDEFLLCSLLRPGPGLIHDCLSLLQANVEVCGVGLVDEHVLRIRGVAVEVVEVVEVVQLELCER
jgi:hypothetical protein